VSLGGQAPAARAASVPPVSVVLDDDARVVAVRIERDEPLLRTPEGLDRGVWAAQVLARGLVRPAEESDTPGERPTDPVDPVEAVTVTDVRRPVQALPDLSGTERTPDLSRYAEARARRGTLTARHGASDNACVRVSFAPAQSVATVEADPGWLARASTGQLADALTQAFAAAQRTP